MRIVIAGCGYLGRVLGLGYLKEGHAVLGLRRDPAAVEALRAEGLNAAAADLLEPDTYPLAALGADLVVLCQAPSRRSDGYGVTYAAACESFGRWAVSHEVRRIVFVSSTSVYGDLGGEWIDETVDPLASGKHSAEARAKAEDLLRAERSILGSGVSACVVRSAGIYGPGRNRIAAVRGAQVPAATKGESYTNRIHVEDLAAAVRVVADKGAPGEVYIASDGSPSTQGDFYDWLFGRLGVRRLFDGCLYTEDQAVRPVRGEANKRCRNDKLRALGWTPRYPSYKEGYEHLITQGE